MNVATHDRLFQTVAKTNLLGLTGPGGLDLDGTRKFLGFSDQDLASATDAGVTQVRSLTQMPQEVKERFEQIATICELVAEHLGSREKAFLWFKTTNPMLGGTFTPRDMLRMGRFRVLHRLVVEALDGI